MRRGEVRWYSFQAPDKRRPVLILTRDSALAFLTGIMVAPLTTTVRNIPTEALLTPEEDGVDAVCAVNLDNVQTVQRDRLGPLVTVLTPSRMREVEQALLFAAGMDDYRRLK
jgi:mRNA interferase MazF